MANAEPVEHLRRFMPHQPPMLLVERVIAADRDGGEAEARFAADSLFVGPDGTVDETVHFELVAQTFAACTAVWRERTGGGAEAEGGYLTSLRSLEIRDTMRAGEPLRIAARATGTVENFVIVDGTVSLDGRVIASCQVMILVGGGA